MFRWVAKIGRVFAKGSLVWQLKDGGSAGINFAQAHPVTEDESTSDDGFIYELPFQPGACVEIIQGYGGTYSHTDEAHFSIDFRVADRTPICAARSGIVYKVTDHFAEGGTHPSLKERANLVSILHIDDTIATYAHLLEDGALVRPGQAVEVGQVIALSGNTGWSRGPHLHFHVADAFYHERIPTSFNTMESGAAIVRAGNWYTRMKSNRREPAVPFSTGGTKQDSRDDVPQCRFTFASELIGFRGELIGSLSNSGFEVGVDYSSIDILHDVYGFEVCGIQCPENAMQITRELMRLFPGWTPGWLHAPDTASQQGWIASIQRDSDRESEYWDV